MPDRELLEKYPLFRAKKIDLPPLPESLFRVPCPSIKMFCPICGSEQTYRMTNALWSEQDERPGPVGAGQMTSTPRLAYKCASCGEHRRYFMVAFDQEKGTATKVGQSPPPDIEISKPLERRLGAYADFYRKGVRSETHGYGIGAFAYYRRIVENVIDKLLADIESLIPPEERPRYEAALAEVVVTRVTERRIELVKDLLPSVLRPDGMNPLSLLHSAFSEGVHEESDEKCLEYAETLRNVLVYLVARVDEAQTAAKTFTDSMRKVLDRNAAKGKQP